MNPALNLIHFYRAAPGRRSAHRPMPIEKAKIRIRPLRLGFVVDPRDVNTLRKVLQVNACLWGGVYNFIIPAFKKTPRRYQDKPFPTPSARNLINGLVEAFEPDFLVETSSGITKGITFESGRVISLHTFMATDDRGRRTYGIDLRTICSALYEESFRFVQRHPPKVLLPQAPDRRYDLLFAATFGEIPKSEEFADFRKHLTDALDAKEELVEVRAFSKLFGREILYPLRVGRYELGTQRGGWMGDDPMLFYMDERSTYDIIDYWNLRAIGWPIRPLPKSWASELHKDCELFIKNAHQPYPQPSNGMHMASFLCSRSCSFDEMQRFVSSLQKPSTTPVSVAWRFPRLWEEWGRRADHAQPQLVTYKTQSVDVHVSGDAVSLQTIVPEFMEHSSSGASENACANVIEDLPGGASVIPWQSADMDALTGLFEGKKIWTGREGIITMAGEYRTHRFLQVPSPINVFASWAEGHKLKLELSPAGRNADQVVKSLGGLAAVQLLGHQDVIRLLDRMARGDLEVELSEDSPTTEKRRRIRMSAAPEALVRETLMRASNGKDRIARNRLKALLNSNVLTLGMKLPCPECEQSNWYGISELKTTLTCERCLRQFKFPQANPPKNAWAYRVIGPFAVENFANGAYSVAFSVHFLAQYVATECTWIPSFKLKGPDITDAEADFGMFLKPGVFSHLQDPLLVFGECKTFGAIESRDYTRMNTIAKLFPGAVICFCKLDAQLSSAEKRQIARIARAGRKPLKTGQQTNPVLVLTGTELFGQFKIGSFTDDYTGNFVGPARDVFLRRDVQEICGFTQQLHLGIESYHAWLEQRRASRKRKLLAKSQQPIESPSR